MFPYIALILAQAATNAKQYSMKNCGRLAPGPFNSVCINTMRALICLAVSAVIWLVADGKATTPYGHLIIIVAGVGTAFNLFTWILSSRFVSLTLLESVCMMGSLILPLILAPYIFNGERVSLCQWIGCALVVVSVFLFMNKSEKGVKREGTLIGKIVVVTVCAVGLTLTTIFKKLYVLNIESKGLGTVEYFTFINFVTVLSVFAVLFGFYYLKELKKVNADGQGARVELPYKKVWFYVLIAAAALYVFECFAVYSNQLPAAIYLPLSKGLNVACTFIMDVIVFKDKVTVKKIVGLVTVTAAIILVNF
jgi:drug/metabolite transporter (DMT)-like permease